MHFRAGETLATTKYPGNIDVFDQGKGYRSKTKNVSAASRGDGYKDDVCLVADNMNITNISIIESGILYEQQHIELCPHTISRA
jgi:hypothetical protein